jgi:hypothetical protein
MRPKELQPDYFLTQQMLEKYFIRRRHPERREFLLPVMDGFAWTGFCQSTSAGFNTIRSKYNKRVLRG